MRYKHLAALLFGTALAAPLAAMPAHADVEDPLFGYCWGSSSCSSNGTNTPTTASVPNFGFTIQPASKTGDDLIVTILVPDNELPQVLPGGFGITGTFSGTATQFNSATYGSEWMNLTPTPQNPTGTPFLSAYLGLNTALFNVQPNNNLGAYLPATQALDPGANGFYAFTVNLTGETQISLFTTPGGPQLTLGQELPLGSYILGFFDPDTTNGVPNSEAAVAIGTANTGAILETTPVPEPSSIAMFGTALAVFGLWFGRKQKAA